MCATLLANVDAYSNPDTHGNGNTDAYHDSNCDSYAHSHTHCYANSDVNAYANPMYRQMFTDPEAPPDSTTAPIGYIYENKTRDSIRLV